MRAPQVPTWTQELLARQLTETTGVRVSDTTVGRMLAALGIRWGMARATVACPWAPRAQVNIPGGPSRRRMWSEP